MSQLFLSSIKYEDKRRELTDNARKIEYIDDVIFNVNNWIILSSNSYAIKIVENLLDIVAIRLPVIKAWSKFTFDEYQQLMEKESILIYFYTKHALTCHNFAQTKKKNCETNKCV